ncbi:MAG: hypothetical protein WC637_07545 [Victivallales bacterium]|jgi:hypothetical protein
MIRFLIGGLLCVFGIELSAAPFPEIPKKSMYWEPLSLCTKGCETAAASSIVKGWDGVGLLILDGGKSLEIPVDINEAGARKLEICHITGGIFSPLSVEVNGKLLGKTDSDPSAPAAPVISSFNLPESPGGQIMLKLTPQGKGTLALAYVLAGDAATSPLPDGIWKTEKLRDGRIKSKTLIHKAASFQGLLLILRASPGAALSMNGKILGTVPEKADSVRIEAPWDEMKFGMNEMEIALPSGSDKFTVESSMTLGYRFFSKIPPEMDPVPGLKDWPRVKITNGIVKMTVAIPDPEKGYYRGTRFEQAGIISSLECGGHTYFAENAVEGRNPVANDHVAGPAGEFWEPLGYDEAETGGTFIKIGVGLLERPYDNNYFFGSSYWIARAFPWDVKISDDSIEFKQVVSDPRGWGYDYTKKISLPPGKTELIIGHSLKNTGSKRIFSSHYSHNFIALDITPPGPDYELNFGYPFRILKRSAKNHFIVNGTNVKLKNSDTTHTMIVPPFNADSNWFTISVPSKKVSIRVNEKYSPRRAAFFHNGAAICPESFFLIDIAPGESAEWIRTYEFGTVKHK